MTFYCQVAISLLLLLAAQTAGYAESKPVELRWSEVAAMVSGQHVQVSLSGGKSVSGEAITVREDSLVMDVTSPAPGFSKGNAAIPKASIDLIRLQRRRGGWGRGIGTTLGVITGLTIGGYVAAKTADSPGTGIPVFLVVAGAITSGGYFLGKGLDTKTTSIRIVP